jgi:hypothetical protein
MNRTVLVISLFSFYHSFGQNAYDTLLTFKIDSFKIDLPFTQNRLSSYDFDADTLWLFYSEEIFYKTLRETAEWNKVRIDFKDFSPVMTFKGVGGQRVLQAQDGKLSVINVSEQKGLSALKFIQLDQKHRGRYVLPNTSKTVVNATADSYVFLLYGGSPGFLSNEKAKNIRKYYEQAPLLGVFDRETGSCQTTFAKYDSAYHKPGTQWAKDFYANYVAERDEYWVGNLLTARIDRYGENYEYIDSFGEFPKTYDHKHPIIESPKENDLIGLQYFVERHHFHDILNSEEYVYRVFAKPTRDTTVLAKDYVHFLFIEEKENGSCSKPNPIIAGQNLLIRNKGLYCQVYRKSDFAFLGDLKLPLKAANRYFGTNSTGGHIFIKYENGKLLLYELTLP